MRSRAQPDTYSCNNSSTALLVVSIVQLRVKETVVVANHFDVPQACLAISSFTYPIQRVLRGNLSCYVPYMVLFLYRTTRLVSFI